MKFLKFIVIFMGILIFSGTAAVIYIVFDKFNSKQIFSNEKNFIRNIDIDDNVEIINANISDEKIIITTTLNQDYQLIIYDLKSNKIINIINIRK